MKTIKETVNEQLIKKALIILSADENNKQMGYSERDRAKLLGCDNIDDYRMKMLVAAKIATKQWEV